MEAFIVLVISLIVLVCIISLIFRIKIYLKVRENSGKINMVLDLLAQTKTKSEKQETPLAVKIRQKEIKITEKTFPQQMRQQPVYKHVQPETKLKTVLSAQPSPKPEIRPLHAKSKSKVDVLPPVNSSVFTTPSLPESKSVKENLGKETLKSESKVAGILSKIWNWIVVGEEFRNPKLSLEYAIATTWLLRIAILFIVIGIGFLLKYSIENSIVGPSGRICLSILSGIIMLIGGIKLLKSKYHVIGQGLLGGSIAIFYFSAFASSMMYNLIPINYSFALMILITIASGVLAVKLDSLLVAILGTIGGYFTPIMLHMGSENIFALFSYILLIGIGVLCIARYKRWKLLNILSFIFTYAVFFITLNKIYDKNIHFATVISFATIYFLLFSGITIVYNLVNKEKSTVLELIGMFTNVTIYSLTTYFLITDLYPKEYVAIVSLGLATFYIIKIFYFIKCKIEDKALMVFLIGFASFFVTITVPLVLSDMWLTTAWAIQAFIFLWMSSKLKNKFLRGIAYLIYLLTFARVLYFDMGNNFIDIETTDYFQEMISRFLTFGMLIISVALGYRLLKNEDPFGQKIINDKGGVILYEDKSRMSGFFIWCAAILTFIFLHFEFYYACNVVYSPLRIPLISLIWVGGIVLVLNKLKTTNKDIFKVILVFLFLGLMVKLFFFDLYALHFRIGHLTYGGGYTLMRFFDFASIIAVISYAYFILAKNKLAGAKLFAVSALSLFFIYTTLELNTFLYNYMPNFKGGGISLLWGIFAISFVFSGIKRNIKAMRYTGLLLFLICALKVFIFDLSQLSSLYRIFAFIALGIFILIGAFIYVRFVETFSTETVELDDACKGVEEQK